MTKQDARRILGDLPRTTEELLAIAAGELEMAEKFETCAGKCGQDDEANKREAEERAEAALTLAETFGTD